MRIIKKLIGLIIGYYHGGKVFTGPININIMIPAKCNHLCIFCFSGKDQRKRKAITEMSSERVFDIVDQAIALKPLSITLSSSGETLLSPDSFAIIKRIASRSRNSIQIIIITNGSKLRIEDLSFFKMYKVGFVISAHAGDADTWERIHGVVGKKQFQDLKDIMCIYSKECQLTVNYVVCKENYSEVLSMREFMLDTKAHSLLFTMVYNVDSLELNYEDELYLETLLTQLEGDLGLEDRKIKTNITLLKSQIRLKHLRKEQKATSQTRCAVPWCFMTIFADGAVNSCCYDSQLIEVGNHGLKKIWEVGFEDIRTGKKRVVDNICDFCPYGEINNMFEKLYFFRK